MKSIVPPQLHSFSRVFEALTGHAPFPWQEALFSELAAGKMRRECDVPTGLGKTSVIAVWIAALAASLLEPARYGRVPRRLAYIVNRRVVVDQATEEVEALQSRLKKAASDESLAVLRPILAALQAAATLPDEGGLTISTLRGQFADNHAWHLDPSRPAIIVGTVDMIGSRILFGGYGGVGRNWRSLQAGLLLRDTWIVLDEAHLVPPFAVLLDGVARHAGLTVDARPFGITRMSATLARDQTRSAVLATPEPPLFGPADLKNAEVKKRVLAPKTLRFISVEGFSTASKAADFKTLLAPRMAREAIELADGKNAVVVFANTVDLVNAITAALKKALPKDSHERVLTLTGEMRGAERDALKSNATLEAFAPGRDRVPSAAPAFLVATACVEVGMDFDADHAVCDAVALERMIQRLGRVNRRGEGNAEIRLLHANDLAMPAAEEISKTPPAIAAVLTLRQLPASDGGHDASPAALRALDLSAELAQQAFSPAPAAPPLDAPQLDDWSLTSLKPKEFPCPKISYWLRGVTEDDSMTTTLVWRAELAFAKSPEDAAAMTEVIPVSPRESAQVATHRVAVLLTALAEKDPSILLVVRSASGESRGERMRGFEDPKKRLGELAAATVFLPSKAGGLLIGIPDASAEALKESVIDQVNDANPARSKWQRALFAQHDGEIAVSLVLPDGDLLPLSPRANETDARAAVIRHLRAEHPEKVIRFEKLVGSLHSTDEEDADEAAGSPDEGQAIAYFEVADDMTAGSDEDLRSLGKREVTLKEHTRVAEAAARTLGEKLGLVPYLCEAIALAALWHDRGKERRWWQAAIGNFDGEPLAKSNRPYFDHSFNEGYRHEFGSLVEARADADLSKHPHRELILHLIAAHHGHARPGFSPNAYDRRISTPEAAAIAAEVPLRFAALQQEHGWWQLAWLEALVKCADAIASTEPDWTPS